MILTDNLNSELMELISEFSDTLMRYQLIGKNEASELLDVKEVEDGAICISYTEPAQDVFNEIYDQVEELVYEILEIDLNN